MDLAVYINELLSQRGELSIPGLGVFSQVRKDGFYDDDKGVLYPPHYETQFHEQGSSDETLAKYISDKKNISVNSASYFVDKYINSLKQQAMSEDVQMDQLGWMRLKDSKFDFRPNTSSNTYEVEYYGLPALSVNKIWEQLSGLNRNPQPVVETVGVADVAVTPDPVLENPDLAIFPDVLTLNNEAPAPVRPVRQNTAINELTTEEDTPKAAVNIWIVLLIVVTVVAITLLALYQYRPTVFNRFTKTTTHTAQVNKPAAKAAPTPQKITAPAVAPSRADTTMAKAPVAATAPVASTDSGAAATGRYQVMGGAFATVKEANEAIRNYKKLGINARIIKNVPGHKIQVTLGSYNTREEANVYKKQLMDAGKVKDTYIKDQTNN